MERSRPEEEEQVLRAAEDSSGVRGTMIEAWQLSQKATIEEAGKGRRGKSIGTLTIKEI